MFDEPAEIFGTGLLALEEGAGLEETGFFVVVFFFDGVVFFFAAFWGADFFVGDFLWVTAFFLVATFFLADVFFFEKAFFREDFFFGGFLAEILPVACRLTGFFFACDFPPRVAETFFFAFVCFFVAI